MRQLSAVMLLLFALLLPVAYVHGQSFEPVEMFKRMGWTKTDFSKTSVKLEEVFSGGPPRDGIPPIDNPEFEPVARITDLSGREPVMSLEIEGDARAYPLRIMIWHEIVNDTVGGKPVSVTYCPLCNAAIVFDRRVGDAVLDFGTSGLLRHSDLIMYDRQTDSWWQQFTGEAIVGDMLGKSLAMLPARLESWAEFKARHPQGKVLVPNDPKLRRYGENPYVGYDRSAKPFLYNGAMPDGISPMARVVVYRHGGKVHAVALSYLVSQGSLRHGPVKLSWKAGQASALDTANIAEGRDVGSVTVARTAPSGQYADIPHDVTFAFVVTAFHPGTDILKE